MNRKQRRAVGIKQTEPIYNVKKSDFDNMKKQLAEVTAERAFLLMLSIPAIVINDDFGKLMKKENRVQTFIDLCLKIYDDFDNDLITLEELKKRLQDEGGVEIKR